MTAGGVSMSVNFANAIASDINGGNGSATGEVIGSVVAEAGVTIATAKAGNAISKGLAKTGSAAKGGYTDCLPGS